MEPLELWAETPPALRLTREPMQAPASPADEAARKSAAALWKTLNMPPEEVLQLEAERSKQEAEISRLRAQLEAEQAGNQTLRQRVAQAETERFSGTVVYGLIGLLLLALLALAWLMRRAHREEVVDDWQHSVAASGAVSGVGAEELVAAPPAEALGDPDQPAAEESAFLTQPEDWADTAIVSERQPLASEVPDVQAPRAHDIEHPEELFDILQQAEFFVSIGEHDQAVSGLRKHIAQHPDSSPLAHLELLRLYHMLGRVEAFEELRGHFEERFNARVPSFATFQHQGRSLEDYPEELARIEALWTSPEVSAVLDGFMFRRQGADGVAPFDLPAYEDLLLLLAVAQTTPARDRGASGARVRTTPMAAAAPEERRALTRSVDSMVGDLSLEPSAYMPLITGGGGDSLDIDLTDPPTEPAPDIPLPDIVEPPDVERRGNEPL